jgi:8-oxo-dGTP diphosphatase
MIKGIDYIGVGITFTCHDGSGNILFAKRGKEARDERGAWELAGGGLKFGETLVEGVFRELREEFCVEPEEYKFVGYHDLLREIDGQKSHWVMLDFLIKVDREKVQIGEPHKCDGIGWYALGEHPEPLHSGVPATLVNIQNHLNVYHA